ncbi:MAG: hypothetical protein ACOCRX_06340 [Candidatus Woesearchaeota archaeon]
MDIVKVREAKKIFNRCIETGIFDDFINEAVTARARTRINKLRRR